LRRRLREFLRNSEMGGDDVYEHEQAAAAVDAGSFNVSMQRYALDFHTTKPHALHTSCEITWYQNHYLYTQHPSEAPPGCS